ncbi:hypothetical protein [Haladaptatus sp. DFWS20]|uniref:hypothetical protein n=1 Tax=Haladaptatus sp. DFWS20 TaxID=3403467 RepID=UPI003EB7BA97
MADDTGQPRTTDQAEKARNQAYIQIGEANWEDVPSRVPPNRRAIHLPSVSIPNFDAAGQSRQMYDTMK